MLAKVIKKAMATTDHSINYTLAISRATAKEYVRGSVMRKKKALAIWLFVVVLTLVTFSCVGKKDLNSYYGVVVTGDGSGGAVVLYERTIGGDFHVQRISADGEFIWGEDGIFLGKGEGKTNSFFFLHIMGDGAGGAFLSWPDSSRPEHRITSYLARVNREGNLLWQKDFPYFEQMISDGSGGVIIGCLPSEKTMVLFRINANGNLTWGENGVSIPLLGRTQQIVSDGNGGVIIIWEESQYPAGVEPGKARAIYSLFAQRINTEGRLLWGDEGANGILVYVFPQEMWIDTFQAVEDGAGGAIITWFQVTEDPSAEPGHQQTWDIVVQRIDTDGNVLWQPEGVPLEITKADSNAVPMEPDLVGDGSGGVVVIWRDTRHNVEGKASIYSQKIDEQGILLWQAGGVKVSSTSLNPRPQIIGIEPGEVAISYSFQEDRKNLHTQKLDNDGNTSWATNGISITEDGFSSQFISSDGQGGIIIAWGVNKGLFSSEKAYVQRVT